MHENSGQVECSVGNECYTKDLETVTLARDMVFEALMLTLNGIIGICIVIRSLR